MLDIKNLSVTYENKTEALQDVSFQLIKGQIVGIVGPNGAGKTTLIKSIVNLMPHKGIARFNDLPIAKQPKNISYVEQKSNIDSTFPMKVLDCVILGFYPILKPWQLPRKQQKHEAEAALKKVNMFEYKDNQIGELSGGQFQRVLIARTLVQQTDIILLDEPFVGIDITSEEIIVELLKELSQKGKTILIVHHDLSKVEKYFDSLIILNKRLIDFGSVATVFNSSNLKAAYGTDILIASESGAHHG
ncbi:metal ABC transporter ATP-binding protein [Staphylococcus sp. mip270_02]|uniref:metal ABC transporter ATP-binding protein n=3 Tax=Staphylococcus xylosus TaxID=1288 RepID=UPI003CF34A02